MISLITLCLYGLSCTALGIEDPLTSEELGFELSSDDYVPAPFTNPAKEDDVISPRRQEEAAKRSSEKIKRQDSGLLPCLFSEFLCYKTHHPLCAVITQRSLNLNRCITKVVCDQNASNANARYFGESVCYASRKAFTLPRDYDAKVPEGVNFHYNVRLIDENGEELPEKLQGFNSSVIAPPHVSGFIMDAKRRINFAKFKIRTRYNCKDLSTCIASDDVSRIL